jgi:predicted RNA-binding Zn-ribbon protein involved in translation (DUF1610 family)
MNGRRAIVGLCMLCALALSAIATQGAAATTKGTTAFTCKEGGSGLQWTDAHCRTRGLGPFGHVAIPENTTTKLKGSNAKTNSDTSGPTSWILKQTVAGVPLESEATTIDSEGSVTNKKDPSGEHYVEGSFSLIFTAVTVKAPAGKGCKVFTDTSEKTKGAEGVVDWNMKFTTTGQGDFLKFEPAEGAAFAKFWIECTTKVEALEGTWEITGSFKCPNSGATVECSHADITTQNTLKGKGTKAGLEGKLTLEGTDPSIGGDTYRPLSFTTVETP